MKSEDRTNYEKGYGEKCLTALLLFGYPPGRTANIEAKDTYWREVRKWWLSTQNPDVHEKRAFRFTRFFNAWCKDQKMRGRRDGII